MSSPQAEGNPANGLYKIEDDLTTPWLEDLADAGIAEIEEYLRKQAAFLIFLENQESSIAEAASTDRDLTG